MAKSQIFLIGMRGSGKSSVGTELADLLGYGFVDTDILFEEEQGKSIEEFVGENGWESFREAERAVLLKTTEPRLVVGTGGGIILNEGNRQYMRDRGVVVFLDVPVAVLAERLMKNRGDGSRPSLTGKDIIDELATVQSERIDIYRQAAHMSVEAEMGPRQVAEFIKRAVETMKKVEK